VLDLRDAFALPPERVWLNCAHQGPLPRVGKKALDEAAVLKLEPHRISDASFTEIPLTLKAVLGTLVGVPREEIVLGNSTSYGLHLLANGIRWRSGDEVLVPQDEFPASVLPWESLRDQGVSVRVAGATTATIDPDTLDREIGSRTRLFCASWVSSFTGRTLDIGALGAVCRQRKVLFVLNASQAIGHRSLNAAAEPVDAISCCGFKWLCGPYATGFCWIRPELRDQLTSGNRYWLAMRSPMAFEFAPERGPAVHAIEESSRFDVFCPASFFTVLPWRDTIQWLLEIGIGNIAAHDDALVSRFIAGLDRSRFRLISPANPGERSPIVVLSHRDASRNAAIHADLAKRGFDCALRAGNLRFSPHLYNSLADIDGALEAIVMSHAAPSTSRSDRAGP
jgi:selenocysteine lyase/cysteine desulfurase